MTSHSRKRIVPQLGSLPVPDEGYASASSSRFLDTSNLASSLRNEGSWRTPRRFLVPAVGQRKTQSSPRAVSASETTSEALCPIHIKLSVWAISSALGLAGWVYLYIPYHLGGLTYQSLWNWAISPRLSPNSSA
jgi:hypothetical protein